jgi:hypothetical protein
MGNANSTSWQKGQSGNPGGRPKVAAAVLELARHHGPDAIARLIELMHSQKETVAIRAAEALLDRAYGRPPQAVAVEHQRPVKIIITDANSQKPEMNPRMPIGMPSQSVEQRREPFRGIHDPPPDHSLHWTLALPHRMNFRALIAHGVNRVLRHVHMRDLPVVTG